MLPSFKEENVNYLYQSLKYAKSMHAIVHRLNKKQRNPLILPPTYHDIPVEEISDELDNILPKASAETLSLCDGENLRTQHLQFLINNTKSSGKLLSSSAFTPTPNEVPIQVITGAAIYSTNNKHISHMGSNQQWLNQLVGFFKDMTEMNVYIDSSISFDSFLFYPTGTIKAFITYDLLEMGNNQDSWKIRKHNLLVFYYLIEELQLYTSENTEVISVLTKEYDSEYNRLYQALQRSDFLLSDFESIEAFINTTHYSKMERNEIGVFLDTANIFTGLQSLKVDFHHLFTLMFGTFMQNHIKDQYATIYYPEFEEESKAIYAHQKVEELRKYLESQGFTILETHNQKSKAKEVVHGIELDIDDQVLISKMEERKEKYNELILFTGDFHFYNIACEYRDSGKKVNLISLSEADTSQDMVREFQESHSFITDYSQCFKLY